MSTDQHLSPDGAAPPESNPTQHMEGDGGGDQGDNEAGVGIGDRDGNGAGAGIGVGAGIGAGIGVGDVEEDEGGLGGERLGVLVARVGKIIPGVRLWCRHVAGGVWDVEGECTGVFRFMIRMAASPVGRVGRMAVFGSDEVSVTGMYIHTCVHTCIHTSVHTRIHTYPYVYVHVYRVHILIFVDIDVCIYTWSCVHMYVHLCTIIYVPSYMYEHTWMGR